MMLLIAKRITSPCFANRSILSRCCSSSPSTTPNPDHKTTHSMVDYLIATFGFTADNAVKVSKKIAHVKSPEKPEAVRNFLKQEGFTEADIKTLVACSPNILCSSPVNTLGPNLSALREIGLSTSALTQIILCDPAALQIRTAAERIRFCRVFFGGCEAALLTAFKKNRSLASNNITSKISLLKDHGLSTNEVGKIIRQIPHFITNSDLLMEEKLKRAKELGFQPGSGMFVSGLHAVSGNSVVGLQKKKELLKGFGWSEDDFFTALRKSPTIGYKSEKNLRAKMDFLMRIVKCDPSCIASNPVILTYSLEKRLMPRHHVLHLLESEGVSTKEYSFFNVVLMTDEKFTERFVLPHKEKISGLHEAYQAACACEPYPIKLDQNEK